MNPFGGSMVVDGSVPMPPTYSGYREPLRQADVNEMVAEALDGITRDEIRDVLDDMLDYARRRATKEQEPLLRLLHDGLWAR